MSSGPCHLPVCGMRRDFSKQRDAGLEGGGLRLLLIQMMIKGKALKKKNLPAPMLLVHTSLAHIRAEVVWRRQAEGGCLVPDGLSKSIPPFYIHLL